MVRVKALVIGALFGVGLALESQGTPALARAHAACPIDMYERAETSLAEVRGNWFSLLKHHQVFVSCDDGALAEGYSDAVVTNFARQWNQFTAFAALAERHPDFRRWAIRHIDATASDEDLKQIMLNAAPCVDVKTKGLCRAIRQAAARALTEQKQLLHK
jgi:hypothetical protein